MKLTCSNCGNNKTWRGAMQTSGGRHTATCARCGNQETRTGGVVLDTVVGDMTMDFRHRRGDR